MAKILEKSILFILFKGLSHLARISVLIVYRERGASVDGDSTPQERSVSVTACECDWGCSVKLRSVGGKGYVSTEIHNLIFAEM